MDTDIKEFVLDFLKDRGPVTGQLQFLPIQGDGSKRLFRRVSFSPSRPGLIVMANPPTDPVAMRENLAYLMIGKHLYHKGIPVPRIYKSDLERGWFLMEDMGPTNLQDLVSSNQDPVPLYVKVLEHLVILQIKGADGFDTGWCCQTERYDRNVMRRYESDYFRDAFLCGYLGLKGVLPELDGPFDYLAETASGADSRFLLHRDFQSRNIMIFEGNTGFIDWQGARMGPLGYDLASLLIDPYTELLPEQKDRLYEHYLLLIREYDSGLIDDLRTYYPYLAIQRNLQILGAFSFLTRTMNKTYFEAYIPAALKTLHDLLRRLNDFRLSPLSDLVKDILVELNLN
jgi:aminoglycoside/choline kinase family phosphotransferase